MNVGPGAYAVLSALVFGIGLYGVLARSSATGVLIAVSLLFTAPVIALVGFTHAGLGGQLPPTGDALAFLALIAMGAEALLGFGIVLLLLRRTGTVAAEPDVAETES